MKKKIFAGLGLLLLIFMTGSTVAMVSIMRTTRSMDRLVLLHQIEIQRERLIIHIQQIQTGIYRGSERRGKDIDLLIAQITEMDKALNSCLSCHHSPELSQGLRSLRDTSDDYKSVISDLFTASMNHSRIAGLEQRAIEIGQDLITMTQGMSFNANVRLQEKTRETMDVIRTAIWVLFGMLVIGFCLAAVIAYKLAKGIDVPCKRLIDATRRIASGDLQYRVEITGREVDEFQEVGTALNMMTQNLYAYRRQIIQSTKLAAIGELATNIAYEVNNPLTGVLGYTGLLLKSDDIPDDKKEHLRTIERETLRAREILKNLLDFARRKPPRLAPTDIRGVVDDALALVRSQARLSGVEIEIDCGDALPLVSVDPDEMKQVFVNIINNAFFSMPSGGRLSIKCSRKEKIAGGGELLISFEDTGAGIPETHLDRIFDPFFPSRVDGAGSGLGLSTSYMIVQNYGGRIDVESILGKGSIFRVVLPLEAAELVARQAIQSQEKA